MAKSKKNTAGKVSPFVIILIAVVLLIVTKNNAEEPAATATPVVGSDTVRVYFIDVGQGSSTLIQQGSDGILVDAGEREAAQTVIDTIKTAGVKTLKYVIATHPHSDHIGGMTDVLNAVKAENIILPRLSQSNTPTTKTYEKFLTAISSNGVKAIAASFGKSYTVGNISIDILGPLVQDQNLNNMSVVCKVNAFRTSILLPGDAEKEEIASMRNKGADFSCDIMLMAHHGSSTSYDTRYLGAASPAMAIISCGKDNDYGHPHKEIRNYLSKNKIETHRTDKEGTIIVDLTASGYRLANAA